MKKNFKVNGMSCQHCVKAVEKAFESMDGVNSINVNLEAKKMTLDYDENKISDNDIKEKVKEVGYEALDDNI